jgi:glutathione synthase/RimK-type ligase-like ATP-grasp enzyme
MTVTLRSANKKATPDFGLFCNPESRRAEGFAIAVGRALRQPLKYVPWQWVLEGSSWKNQLEDAPRFLRLESPDRNWKVEQQLLLRGAALEDEEAGRAWRRLASNDVASLPNDPGRVLPMRQWFLGWRQTLEEIGTWATKRGFATRWLCPPEDVLCMFDKLACHRKLESAGIAVPPVLGLPRSFDELWELMKCSGRKRVFLKPCHGSSASGIVALEASRSEIQAFSTLELVDETTGVRLYNRRRIRLWRGAAEVRRLVDAACAERCLAQVWIPKAGMFGSPCDLRIVVIGGRARHIMLRLGRGPMTNSQLLGGKGEVEALRRRMGEESWLRMLGACEQVMTRCFPRSLYAGLDVLIEPDFRTARILEVNAFGDLLPRVLHDGRETYQWEVEEALRRGPIQVSATGA